MKSIPSFVHLVRNRITTIYAGQNPYIFMGHALDWVARTDRNLGRTGSYVAI